jgi:quinoprotein glucose dehydrogenase
VNLRIVLLPAAALIVWMVWPAAEQPWPGYGGGPLDNRYSPLKQIDTSNVSKLKVAWTYDTKDGAGDTQTQPLMVNGTVYGVTPKHKIVAIDAANGARKWQFDSGVRGRGANRSVMYWAGGNEHYLCPECADRQGDRELWQRRPHRSA